MRATSGSAWIPAYTTARAVARRVLEPHSRPSSGSERERDDLRERRQPVDRAVGVRDQGDLLDRVVDGPDGSGWNAGSGPRCIGGGVGAGRDDKRAQVRRMHGDEIVDVLPLIRDRLAEVGKGAIRAKRALHDLRDRLSRGPGLGLGSIGAKSSRVRRANRNQGRRNQVRGRRRRAWIARCTCASSCSSRRRCRGSQPVE